MIDNTEIKRLRVSNELFFEIILKELNVGKTVKFNVTGNSMLPFLRNGDQVIIKRPLMSEIGIGSIVLASYQEKIILHRVVKIKNDIYYLAGDGNLDQVEEVNVRDLLAYVLKGMRGYKELNLNTIFSKKLGIIWYHIRPLRYLFNKF